VRRVRPAVLGRTHHSFRSITLVIPGATRARLAITLIRLGWGANHTAFRQLWTAIYIPGAAAEMWDWWNEM
jgi:hypothetical protein